MVFFLGGGEGCKGGSGEWFVRGWRLRFRDWCFDICRAGGFLLELAFGPGFVPVCNRALVIFGLGFGTVLPCGMGWVRSQFHI